MDYRILGPLELVDGTTPLPLTGGRQRALLALLLIHRNEVVSADRLIDALWGETPPPSAPKALQNAVLQVRRALGDGAAAAADRARRLRARASPRASSTPTASRRWPRDGRAALDAGDPASAARAAARGARAVARPAAVRPRPTRRSPSPRSRGSRRSGSRRSRTGSRPTSRSAAAPTWSAELEAEVARHPLRERLRAAADARALPRGPPGRRARGVPRRPPRAGRRARDRARARAARAARGDPAPGPGARRRPARAARRRPRSARASRLLAGAAALLLLAAAVGGARSSPRAARSRRPRGSRACRATRSWRSTCAPAGSPASYPAGSTPTSVAAGAGGDVGAQRGRRHAHPRRSRRRPPRARSAFPTPPSTSRQGATASGR